MCELMPAFSGGEGQSRIYALSTSPGGALRGHGYPIFLCYLLSECLPQSTCHQEYGGEMVSLLMALTDAWMRLFHVEKPERTEQGVVCGEGRRERGLC